MRGDKEASGNPFRAVRHVDRPVTAARVPSIAGSWIIPHESPKGEKAWRFIVTQNGAEASAAILRVDGDTGALTGRCGFARSARMSGCASSSVPEAGSWQ